MGNSVAERAVGVEAYEAWSELTRKLVGQFHNGAPHPAEVKQVEAAIIDLVAEYLWLDLGGRAAWDMFDVHHWREMVAMNEPTYRSRVRATLINFYEHLTTSGLVSVPASNRIQDALAECLADSASSATSRSSYLRLSVDLDDSGEAVPFARRR
jgi:hypothetical protein